jgi:hypothetical protein
MPVLPAGRASEEIGRFREMVTAAGRDPDTVGIENIIFVGRTMGQPKRSWEEGAADVQAWRAAGATHVAIHTMDADLATPDAHLDYLRKLRDAAG